MRNFSTADPRMPSGRLPGLSRLSDERLARHAERGSERAFTILYERYHQPLYRYCRSIVRDDADAQDALQSTFTGALAALRRSARNAPLRPWLYRIAHNESISLLRRRRRDAQHPALTEPLAVSVSAEEEAADRARWQRVLADLRQLPDRQRGALLLRELAGLSHEEIALALELTVGGAKQAIFEAREALADVEEGRRMSCEEVRRRISEGDRRVLRGRRVRAHLRDCAGCEAFVEAIPARQSDLRALVPVLPSAATAAVLSRVIRAGSPHGGASAGSAATVGALGKTLGATAGWKTLAAAGLVAGSAAGVTSVTHVLHPPRATSRPVVAAWPMAGARSATGGQAKAAGGGAAITIQVPAGGGHRRVQATSKGHASIVAARSGAAAVLFALSTGAPSVAGLPGADGPATASPGHAGGGRGSGAASITGPTHPRSGTTPGRLRQTSFPRHGGGSSVSTGSRHVFTSGPTHSSTRTHGSGGSHARPLVALKATRPGRTTPSPSGSGASLQ